MTDNIHRYYTLGNSLASVSAVMLDNSTLATDGFNPKVFEFDLSGNQIACHQVTRPYRRLREINNGYTAIDCCNGNRLYFLNPELNETDCITLQATQRSRNSCNNSACLVDASVTQIGSESFIIGAFDKNAYLFDLCGNRLTRLCSADSGELLTDFVTLGNGCYAMATRSCNTQTVTISDGNNSQAANLLGKYILRMLIPCGNELFGLFGKGYIYNRIIKIYSGTFLNLPA